MQNRKPKGAYASKYITYGRGGMGGRRNQIGASQNTAARFHTTTPPFGAEITRYREDKSGPHQPGRTPRNITPTITPNTNEQTLWGETRTFSRPHWKQHWGRNIDKRCRKHMVRNDLPNTTQESAKIRGGHIPVRHVHPHTAAGNTRPGPCFCANWK